MEILTLLRSYAWILVVLISLSVIWLTLTKMKGSFFFRISFGIFRALIFFAIFYNPLMPQARIEDNIVLPLVSLGLLVGGMILNGIGTRELVKTKLGGVKGIPDKIITSGIYRYIRHPINLGFMFIFAGWYLLWAGIISLYFLPILILIFVLVSFYEERNLIKVFGEEYISFKKRVGMFIPKL